MIRIRNKYKLTFQGVDYLITLTPEKRNWEGSHYSYTIKRVKTTILSITYLNTVFRSNDWKGNSKKYGRTFEYFLIKDDAHFREEVALQIMTVYTDAEKSRRVRSDIIDLDD